MVRIATGERGAGVLYFYRIYRITTVHSLTPSFATVAVLVLGLVVDCVWLPRRRISLALSLCPPPYISPPILSRSVWR